MAWVASPLSIPQLPNPSSRHDVVSTLSTTKPKLTLSKPSSFTTTTLTLTFFPPQNFPQNSNSNFNRSLTVRSHLNFPLISPQDHWGILTALFATGAFGLWAEKAKIGSMVSAALVSTLVGLGASNMGIIRYEASAYSIVLQFLLPLTAPLLLFRADLRHVVCSTGPLLLAFLLGSAVNYIAISEALGLSPSVLAAGVAADNVICALYFVLLFALASKIPSEAPASTDDAATDMESDSGNKLPVLQTAAALAVSFSICKTASWLTKLSGIK